MGDIQIKFARIDARDDSYTGYSPVAFATRRGPVPLGKEGLALSMMMKCDYLQRVAKVQEDIRREYEGLLDLQENPLPHGDPGDA